MAVGWVFLLWGAYLIFFSTIANPAYHVLIELAPRTFWAVFFTLYGGAVILATWKRWLKARRFFALSSVGLLAVCCYATWTGLRGPGFFPFLVLLCVSFITYCRLHVRDYITISMN